jgi:hypothetical protein
MKHIGGQVKKNKNKEPTDAEKSKERLNAMEAKTEKK